MKKSFFAVIVPFFVFTLLCGCSGKVPEMEDSMSVAETSAETTKTTEQPTTAPPLRLSDGVYIYDNAELFGKAELEEINGYACYISENFGMDTAVVTESDIEGETPADFAEKRYNELYGESESGMLLLINNDTKVDFLYKRGICAECISDEEEKNAFYTATREIVDGDYKSAVIRILSLAESCSVDEKEITTE